MNSGRLPKRDKPLAHGYFVWTDLSTYDIETARADYAQLFGWAFSNDDAYDFALLNDAPVAAIFPMPSRLATMDMPSFWMSYIQVDDLDAIVAQARTHEGVIIEVEPQAFGENSRVALVRDPSGAGFTLSEGPEIGQSQAGAGTVTGRFHHLADVSTIEPFYRDLFNWQFEQLDNSQWPSFNVWHPDGSFVAQIEEVPETVRGRFSYWMPCFAVKSVDETSEEIQRNQGEVLSALPEDRVMIADRQGAHFMISSN